MPIFLLIFGLLWTAGTIFMGVDMGKKTQRQYHSKDYPQTTGVIRKSELDVRKSSKSTSYTADIEYEYTVNGKVYTGTDVRFGLKVSSKSSAEEEVKRYPLGKEVTVFYDPSEPEQALLETTLRGSDFFGLLFLTPFLCIGLGLVVGGFHSLRKQFGSGEAGGAKILTSAGGRTQVRLPEMLPSVLALITVGVLSFICIFVVGLLTRMTPSFALVLLAWLACIIAGAVVYLREFSRLSMGYYDLVIDTGSAMVSLPRIYGLKTPKAVGFRDIRSIQVKENVSRNKKGRTSRSYDVMLNLADGFQHKIATRTQQIQAASLASWLRQKLGLDA